jgi:hypothetical protein
MDVLIRIWQESGEFLLIMGGLTAVLFWLTSQLPSTVIVAARPTEDRDDDQAYEDLAVERTAELAAARVLQHPSAARRVESVESRPGA